MSKIKVLLTGSAGFIGKNLQPLLSASDKYEVVEFSGDLTNAAEVTSFFEKEKDVNTVVHLAGIFSNDFNKLLEINVEATANLLAASVKNGIAKIVFTSTGAVYGEPVGDISSENDPLLPVTLYGLSKVYAEELVQYYNHNYGLNYVILRFPNVYGAGNDKGVIYSFINNIRSNGKITLNGDGTQSRNFLHVEDACRAIEMSINYGSSDVFNISLAKKYSLNDVIDLLQETYAFEVNKVPADNNLKDLLLDTRKSEERLNFQPVHKFLDINHL